MAGSRVGSRHLQNVEKKIKFPRPVLSDQQEKWIEFSTNWKVRQTGWDGFWIFYRIMWEFDRETTQKPRQGGFNDGRKGASPNKGRPKT